MQGEVHMVEGLHPRKALREASDLKQLRLFRRRWHHVLAGLYAKQQAVARLLP